MSTSQTTALSKPKDSEKIPIETFAYLRARAKRLAYELVLKEFERSGLTKAELARRLSKGPDRVSRMLGGPGNWTLATVADLLFAISGGVPKFDVDYPLDKPQRNFRQPEWLNDPRADLVRALGKPSRTINGFQPIEALIAPGRPTIQKDRVQTPADLVNKLSSRS